MGVEYTGILFWGLAFNQKHRPPWGEDPDFPKVYDWEDRWSALSQHSPDLAAQATGCLVGLHQSWDVPMAYVTIQESLAEVDYREAMVIPNFTIDPTWSDRLQAFCQLMTIPWQDPDWWIVNRVDH